MQFMWSRWLMMAGLLAAIGGCRHAECPQSCSCSPTCTEQAKPVVPSPDVLREAPPSMPTIPLEAAAPISAGPKRTARRSTPKQECLQVQQVEYQAVAGPRLGHAPDHSWLVGQLEREDASDRWYIRYADPGEQDRLGGRLELIRTGPMAGFRVGQTVRAEGELVDPAPLETKMAYRTQSLQALPQ